MGYAVSMGTSIRGAAALAMIIPVARDQEPMTLNVGGPLKEVHRDRGRLAAFLHKVLEPIRKAAVRQTAIQSRQIRSSALTAPVAHARGLSQNQCQSRPQTSRSDGQSAVALAHKNDRPCGAGICNPDAQDTWLRQCCSANSGNEPPRPLAMRPPSVVSR